MGFFLLQTTVTTLHPLQLLMDAALLISQPIVCKVFILVGNGSPFCDLSGCQFALAGRFYVTLPSGLAETYTIAIWTREVFDTSTPFSLVPVRITEIRTT